MPPKQILLGRPLGRFLQYRTGGPNRGEFQNVTAVDVLVATDFLPPAWEAASGGGAGQWR